MKPERANAVLLITRKILSNVIQSMRHISVAQLKDRWIFIFLFFISSFAHGQCKVYSGSTGYHVAARVDSGRVFSGARSYRVLARLENGKLYSGRSGYTVIARIEGNKIYGGSSGYNIIGRIDGDKIYFGSTGYKIAARNEGCGCMSFAAAAASCCL